MVSETCEFDLFVSYAQIDDEAVDGVGRVTTLMRHLEVALKQRVGPVRIFFDERTGTNGIDNLSDFLKQVSRSALFLAIGSRNYVMRPWTRNELACFARQPDALDRLFLAELLPLPDELVYPAPLPDKIASRFWRAHPRSKVPMAVNPKALADVVSDTSDSVVDYHSIIDDLAHKIVRQLDANRQPPKPPPADRRRVLVAQVPDDMEEYANQLCRYLDQFETELEVIRADAYPQGGDAFAAAFVEDLGKADLFVQLLGPRQGRKPRDLPMGYTVFQADQARAADAQTLHWQLPDIDAAAGDDAYRKLLEDEGMAGVGFEEFKGIVLERARAGRPSIAPSGARIAFIDADEGDIGIAESICGDFRAARSVFATELPVTGEPTEKIRKHLERMFTEAEVLVLVHGENHPEWVNGHIKLFDRLKPNRRTEARMLAVCTVPPAGQRTFKSKVADVRHVDLSTGYRPDQIQSFVRELNP